MPGCKKGAPTHCRKAHFLSSLSDEERHFFQEYEHETNLEKVLLDKLSQNQMKLYREWKQHNNIRNSSSTNEPIQSINQAAEEELVKISKAIMPMTQQEYQDKKERKFLKMLENWQMGVYFAKKNQPNFSKKMREVLNDEQYNKYEELRDLEVLSLPTFVNHVLSATERDQFSKLVNSRNFEAIDAWMVLLPDYQEEYKAWIIDLKGKFPHLQCTKISDETRKLIENAIVNAEQSKSRQEILEEQDSTLFRGRQDSYCKRKEKNHDSNQLSTRFDERSVIDKRREEGKCRNANSDSSAYVHSGIIDNTPDLSADNQLLLENEISALHNDQKHSETGYVTYSLSNHDNKFLVLEPSVDIKPTEPVNPVTHTPNEEKVITAGNLKELREKTIENLPEEVNILLLGESGVGKSTFLNSFGNYLSYNSPDEALRNGIQLLTHVNCIVYDNDRNPNEISEGPDGSAASKIDERTADPQIHTFETKLTNGSKKFIRLLDTPGVDDEQGMETDKLNLPKIMKTLSEFKHINAICILMPSNEARMNTMFRYCMNALMTQLDKSVGNNIFFCFTRSRTTMYRFGDTVPNLRKYFAGLNVDIPVDESTAFCFDNECVKYLLAKKRGMAYGENEESEYLTSWNKSSEATFRLLEKVSERIPVSINNTLNLNQTRSFLERIAMPLMEILKVHVMNKQLLEQKMQALTVNYQSEKQKTDSVLYKPKHVLAVRALDKPQMVCTSPLCSKTNTVATEYKVCHRGCIVRKASNKIPHPELEFCCKIRNGNCSVCGCSWTNHKHMTETFDTQEVEPTLSSHSQKEEKMMFENEIREISLEIDAILSSCGQFSAYIAANALTEETDVFKTAFDEMTEKVIAIKGAVEKSIKTSGHLYDNSALENTKENKLFAELINTKVRYLNASAHSQQKNVDIDLVANTIETLKSLKCWSTVVEAVEANFKKYNEEIASKIKEGECF